MMLLFLPYDDIFRLFGESADEAEIINKMSLLYFKFVNNTKKNALCSWIMNSEHFSFNYARDTFVAAGPFSL